MMCEKEFGRIPIPPGYGKSHGYCHRHAVEAWSQINPRRTVPFSTIPDLSLLDPYEQKNWKIATMPYTEEPTALN